MQAAIDAGLSYYEIFGAFVADCARERRAEDPNFIPWTTERGPAKILELTIEGLSMNQTCPASFLAWVRAEENRKTCEQIIAGVIGLM